MRCSLSFIVLFLFASFASAQDFKMEPPKSPQDSLKCIKTRPGFKVELMVAEPLVMDPIAFAWGPDGKFWVVEMGDYPLGVDGKGKFGGRVKFLEKTKASRKRERPEDKKQPEDKNPDDGPYDKATLFLDNLARFRTGAPLLHEVDKALGY